MRPRAPSHRMPSRLLPTRPKTGLFLGMLGFALLDQLSKLWVKAALRPENPVPVIPHIFQLTLTYNTGAAFSMLRHQPQSLALISSLIFLVLLIYGFSRRRYLPGEVPALAMILGGAIGNLIDRFWAHKVTDFLDVVAIHYPVFNLADSFIFCGVLWLIFLNLKPTPAGTP